MCGDWEFEDVDGEPSGGMSFSRLLADIQRKRRSKNASRKHRMETWTHPRQWCSRRTTRDADGQQIDGKEFIHMIERVIRWYRRRWGIENGFKEQKHFMVRTTSTESDYRFFNFAFACVLYNI